MLVPAILYKDEIRKNFMKYNYTEEMMYYTGCLGNYLPKFEEENNDGVYQYAITDNDKLIGYFAFMIDWYNSCVYNFGLFSFDRNNKTIGFDVYRELKKIINDYHIHRIEWRMIGGNDVERHYDNFCNKYNGKKFVFTDVIKDKKGNYHDSILYEIVFRQEGKENDKL